MADNDQNAAVANADAETMDKMEVLTPLERAAVILLLLGEEQAAEIITYM